MVRVQICLILAVLASAACAAPAADDYEGRLTAIYEKYNKDKLSTVQATLAKYKGREAYLFQLLKEKYGAEPGQEKADDAAGASDDDKGDDKKEAERESEEEAGAEDGWGRGEHDVRFLTADDFDAQV
jgi:hypothetical protein